jgi:hypothetical protein
MLIARTIGFNCRFRRRVSHARSALSRILATGPAPTSQLAGSPSVFGFEVAADSGATFESCVSGFAAEKSNGSLGGSDVSLIVFTRLAISMA